MNTKKLKGILIGDYEVPGTVDNLWIDTSNPKKVATKVFVNGEWKTSGGGASADDITPGNLITVDADGKLVDANKSASDFVETPETAGTSGQLLSTNAQGETEWINPNYVEAPSTAGTEGQILKMGSDGPEWGNAPAGSVMDDEMSDISENPVQNKVIKSYVDGKVTQTTGDSTEAVMSQKAVTDEFKQLDETFAKKDGDYSEDGLVSAKAQNLVGEPIEITDAYTYKPTAYNQSGEPIEVADGRCEMNVVEGRGVSWNQLVTNGDFSNGTTEWTAESVTITVSNGIASVVMGDNTTGINQVVNPIVGHKYFVCGYINTPNANVKISFCSTDIGPSDINKWILVSKVITATGTDKKIRLISRNNDTLGVTVLVKDLNLIDLTLLNPSLASKSNLTVAEVEAYLATLRTPQPYYAQNDGTLLGAKMLGWSMPKTPNLFNPTTGKATLVEYSYNEGTTDNSNKYEITGLSNLTDPVITFTPYTTGVALTVAASDGDITLTHDSTNGGDYFTIPSAGELTITGTGDKNYVCVKMVWDDSKAGEWYVYSLSDNEFDTAKIYHYNSSTEQYDQVFQDGILRATGDGSDAVRDKLFTWIDGEGKVKCGVELPLLQEIDLGDLTWDRYSSSYSHAFKAIVTGLKNKSQFLSVLGYSTASTWGQVGLVTDKSYFCGSNIVYICNYAYDSTTSEGIAAFKSAMSGIKIWAEATTPVTYTSDLYYKKSNNEYVPLEDMFPIQGMCCNWSYESLTQEALDNNGQPQSVTPQTVEEFESDEREKINTVIDTYMSKAAVKGSFENLATAISSLGALTVGDFNSDGELTFSFTPAS